MRIISKFHDYYDSVMRDDARDARCWVRKPRIELVELGGTVLPWNAEVPGRKDGGVVGERTLGTDLGWSGRAALERVCAVGGPEASLAARNASGSLEGAREALVLIAGKAYPVFVAGSGFLRFASQQDQTGPTIGPRLDRACYPLALGIPAHARDRSMIGGTHDDLFGAWRRDIERALNMASADGRNAEVLATLPGGSAEVFFERTELRFCLGGWQWENGERKARVYTSALAEAMAHDWTSLHLQLGSPVLVLSRWRSSGLYGASARAEPVTEVTVDPCLDMLRFSARIDPFTLFQEVSMFVEGVMPDHSRDMVDLSDRSRVLKGGFDPVYGFRTRPRGKSDGGAPAKRRRDIKA